MKNNNPYMKASFPEFKNVKELNENDAGKEMNLLRKAIEHHNRLYYEKSKPVISDGSYDKLFRRLRELEEYFPGLKSESSPTEKVGAPVEKLKKIRHAKPMLSLDSVLKENEFDKRIEFILKRTKESEQDFVAEPKFDGLSVELIYRDGIFRTGSTRGDGTEGEDISLNLKTIRTIPLKINAPGISFLSLRGEIYMSRNGFRELNRQRLQNNEEPFANPRNAASGIVRQLNPGRVAGKPLDIYFYEILDSDNHKFKSHWEMLNWLKKTGFRTNPLKRLKTFTMRFREKEKTWIMKLTASL